MVKLELQEGHVDLDSWLTKTYSPTNKDKQAYYYGRDCHDTDLSQAEDGEELRFH